MDAIELSLFASRLGAVCQEMGATLRRTAVSPNIRDRLDFSCVIFDGEGQFCAQAAHIPVHLGSMAYAMRGVTAGYDWLDGAMVVLNDPFLGGTHLPDVTVIAPVLAEGRVVAFVANRAHHADIGANTPGSMPIARTVYEEGVIIKPQKLVNGDSLVPDFLKSLTNGFRNPSHSLADFRAQISANQTGVSRLRSMAKEYGATEFLRLCCELNHSAQRSAAHMMRQLPNGHFTFVDYLDDDGQGQRSLPIRVSLTIDEQSFVVDFSGTARQSRGNVNCPLSVTAAAVYYVFYALLPGGTPACQGAFRPVTIQAPAGCLVNARSPAAVAAGNVETSSRIVDTLLGALAQAIPDRIPAASQGTMNNIAMGAANWAYYETIGGGSGAHRFADGCDAIQTHMTNTLNTPIEVLEQNYPIRIDRYQVRRGSGGIGHHSGGNGIIREYRFLAPASVVLITERRSIAPWGLDGAAPAQTGLNLLNGQPLPSKIQITVERGDALTIATPGGGGWGANTESES